MAEPNIPDEMLAGLRDIRLPDVAPGGLIAEIAVAVGFGLLVACAISFLLPLISRKTRETANSLRDQLSHISTFPEPQRNVALLHLIRRMSPEAAASLKDRLYRRDGFPASGELEQLALKLEADPHA
ncbi:MAG: hypothetical protein ABJI96_06055 [Paracoccaceae bacterium]